MIHSFSMSSTVIHKLIAHKPKKYVYEIYKKKDLIYKGI